MSDVFKHFDLDLALKRIRYDTRTDFLYIPQFTMIYEKAGDKLFELSKRTISRPYSPLSPIILDVVKESGLTRPGGALWPVDRLIYQALADVITPKIEEMIDRTHVISNQLNPNPSSEEMFKPHSLCYRELQDKIRKYAKKGIYKYTVVGDVNSYFENINIHQFESSLTRLIDKPIVKFLDEFLKNLSGRQSRGLVQGLFPSDLLGNFYLCTLDEQIDALEIPYLRYVDDLFFFFKKEKDAKRFLGSLSGILRLDGLSLNESKTRIKKTKQLYHVKSKIDQLFDQARDRIEKAEEMSGRHYQLYGDQFEWEGEDKDIDLNIDLEAAKELFDLIPESPKNSTKILKFTLPMFIATGDDYALNYVVKNYLKFPHLSSVFSFYLAKLSHTIDLNESLCSYVNDEDLFYPSQLMWYLALLNTSDAFSKETIKFARDIWLNRENQDVVRGVACLYLARHGVATHRKLLRDSYSRESQLIKTYILFSLQHFPEEERKALRRGWIKESELNQLIIETMNASGL